MQWPKVNVRCWTDSTIVLAWLRGHPSEYSVFVANRTAEIQRHFPIDHWQHVSSVDNPADCASRGITPQQLLHHRLWWTGPKWLKEKPNEWPHQQTIPQTSEEVRTRVNNAIVADQCWELIHKYSCWSRLVRVTAYCVRFTQNCRRRSSAERIIGPLLTAELMYAREFWVRAAQAVAFHDELHSLHTTMEIRKSFSLRALNPFIFTENILCVGGRLINAHEMMARTPAIVPRRSCPHC